MVTSIHAGIYWQPMHIVRAGPRHLMSGNRRRAPKMRHDARAGTVLGSSPSVQSKCDDARQSAQTLTLIRDRLLLEIVPSSKTWTPHLPHLLGPGDELIVSDILGTASLFATR